MSQDLQSKAVSIKGKEYVLVKDRILAFNETYPKGSITTELLSKPEDTQIVIKATVKPDSDGTRVFIGHSQAVVGQGHINQTAALENAETSAVGRALAMMGIGIIESVASADEMYKAKGSEPVPQPSPSMQAKPATKTNPFGQKVVGEVCKDCGVGTYVMSKTSGNVYCNKFCWNKKEQSQPVANAQHEEINPDDLPF